jgi:hypothetical protein
MENHLRQPASGAWAIARWALAAALCASADVSAIEICLCDKPPLIEACSAVCKPGQGAIILPTPPPKGPGVNPFSSKPKPEVFDKSQILERWQGQKIDMKGGVPAQRMER